MENNNPFEIDFDSYIRQSEPEKQENGRLWQTAIGLQQVDGLKTSEYLYETAKRNIDGEITIEEAKRLIDSYYGPDRVGQKSKAMLKRPIRFLSAFVKSLRKRHSVLRQIYCSRFISACFPMSSIR